MEPVPPAFGAARGRVYPLQRVVVRVAYEEAAVGGDGDALRMLHAHVVAGTVHITEVEQAGAYEGAHAP